MIGIIMSFVYPGILQYGFPELDLTNLNKTQGEFREFFSFELQLFQEKNSKNHNKVEFWDLPTDFKYPRLHPKYDFLDFPIWL